MSLKNYKLWYLSPVSRKVVPVMLPWKEYRVLWGTLEAWSGLWYRLEGWLLNIFIRLACGVDGTYWVWGGAITIAIIAKPSPSALPNKEKDSTILSIALLVRVALSLRLATIDSFIFSLSWTNLRNILFCWAAERFFSSSLRLLSANYVYCHDR